MNHNNNGINKLKLISTNDEVGNIRTFSFEKNGLSWLAGQSQGYILPQADGTGPDHQRWFTISSPPSANTINISTRVSESAFKQALNKMKPGEEILAFDLGGDFTWEDKNDDPVILVAGGIGITPFHSILLERDKTGRQIPATLLYFNRTHEIPFEKELKILEKKHPEFNMKIIVGENITADRIMQLAPEASVQTVYLSGPEPMVEVIAKLLTHQGVKVKQDRFPGYTEVNY